MREGEGEGEKQRGRGRGTCEKRKGKWEGRGVSEYLKDGVLIAAIPKIGQSCSKLQGVDILLSRERN